MKHLLACIFALCLAAATAAETTVAWDFRNGLQGWKPDNFKTYAITPNGFEGVTRYDCLLTSPTLNLKASDYDRAIVRVSSSVAGSCDFFVQTPGKPFSDKRKATIYLQASDKLQYVEFRLDKTPGWENTITRIRFDAINPADANVKIQSIVLCKIQDNMLANGDLEIMDDGATPAGWTLAGAKAISRPQAAASGMTFLNLEAPGASASCEFPDVSYLGTFDLSFSSKGAPVTLAAAFRDRHGAICGTQFVTAPAAKDWAKTAAVITAPDMAYAGTIRVLAENGGAQFDCLRVKQRTVAYILQKPVVRQRWCGQWIWCAENATADNCTAWLRKKIAIPEKPIRSACIQITCDDTFTLNINGQKVYENHGEIDVWKKPVVLDIAKYLKAGENTFLMEACEINGAQGFLANAAIDADGQFITLHTDTTWDASPNPDGPWTPAVSMGTPPCQPWFDLPYRPMGTMPTLVGTIGSLPASVRPGQSLAVPVTFKPFSFDGPIGICATLVQDGKTLTEDWRPDGLNANSLILPLHIPVAAKPGKATVRIAFNGAVSAPITADVTVKPPVQQSFQFPDTRLVSKNGITWVSVNGQLIDPTQILFSHFDSLHTKLAERTGVHLLDIQVQEFGFYQDGFDYTALDKILENYLNADPDAWLIFNFNLSTSHHHRWWLEQHPEARCRHEDGSDTIGAYSGAKGFMPSYSSPVWREAFGNAIRQMLRHLKTTPYAERIVGMHPSCGISSEWFHWGSQSREFVDYSDCGKAAFRAWLKSKYATDDALQAAWNRKDITLGNAPMPSEASRKTPQAGLFFDVKTQRDVLDYHEFQHFSVTDTIRYFCRIIKEETGGRCLAGTYYGYTCHIYETSFFGQNSGHFNLRTMLDAPEFDFFMAPDAYTRRNLGGSSATMVTTHTYNLNGKIFWNQADLRPHWSPQRNHGNVTTIRGDVECMQRELARNLSEGNAIQWYDFSYGWTMGDKRLTDVIDQHNKLILKYRGAVADFPEEDYLLLVVDESSMGTFNVFTPPYRGMLINQQVLDLLQAGVPWRSVLFSDLFKHPEKLLKYKAMLFLANFRLSDEQTAFIKNKIMTGNRTVAFVGPVGIFGKDGLATDAAKQLLGQDFRIESAPVSLQATCTELFPALKDKKYGLPVQFQFPSVMLPVDLPPALVAANFSQTGTPAAFYKELPDCNLFWSAAPGLPPELVRELATRAKLPVISDTNDAIYAGCGFIGIHAATDGVKTLNLIGDGTPREILTNTVWPKGTHTVKLDLATGDTRIFIME